MFSTKSPELGLFLLIILFFKLPNYNPDDGDRNISKDIKDGGCFITI